MNKPTFKTWLQAKGADILSAIIIALISIAAVYFATYCCLWLVVEPTQLWIKTIGAVGLLAEVVAGFNVAVRQTE